MSSLDEYFNPLVGFFSYSREDDENSNDALSEFRDALQKELSDQLGRSRGDFRIWQDKTAIAHGDNWEKEINDAISQSVFFIPIVTPRAIKRGYCAFEFKSFLAREAGLGRTDLIFPILYIPLPELEDGRWRGNPVLEVVKQRQYFDWTNFRSRNLNDPLVRDEIIRFCESMSNALRRPWLSPEERNQQEQENAKRRAAEQAEFERQTQEAKQRESARLEGELAERERQQREECEAEAREAARLDAQRRAAAERERILQERRQQQSTAERRATQEWAFNTARRRGTAAAIDSFLTAHPDSHLADQADQLKTELLVRQEAFERAIASSEPPVLRAFLATYPNGSDANRVRGRLLLLEARLGWKSRPAMAIAAAVVLLFLGALAYHFSDASRVTGSSPPMRQALLTPAAPQPQPQSTVTEPPPSPKSPPVITPVPSTAQSGSTAQFTQLANALPNAAPLRPAASPPPSWAACGPNPAPPTAPMGDGGFQGAPIKIALTKAQRDVIAVRTLAISPDGRTLVSAGDDAIIRFWDAANLKLIRAISGGHSAAIYSAAFSSDGKFLASASFDGTVQIWDAHTFAHVNTFDTERFAGRVKVQQFAVAFEPVNDPHYVDSVGADGTVWIWDLRSGQLAANPRSSSSTVDARVGSLGFAPDGSGTYATANFDGTIKFVDPGHSDVITAFSGKALRLAYSPNGALVAAAGADAPGKMSGVKIWDAATHALFKALPAHHGHAASVAWSRDGTRLATGGGYSDPSVALWDVQSGRPVPQFDGHTADVDTKDYDSKDIEAVVFHPHRKWLISASEAGRIKIWNAATGKELLSIVAIPGGDDYVAYTPTGCYTGSANAANYVRYVTKFGDRTGTALLVPNGAADFLLPQ